MSSTKTTVSLWLIAAAWSLFSTPANTQTLAIVPDEIRSAERPLPMVVHFSQDKLITGRDPGFDYEVGGGLIGGLVVGAAQSLISDGAEDAFAPSENLFSKDEAEQAFKAAIRDSVAPISWIELVNDDSSLDSNLGTKTALLDQSPSSHILSAHCLYNISNRFQAVYAFCSLHVLSKEINLSAKKQKGPNLVFSTYVEAQVELANIAKSVGGRREQWIANSGALLRESLQHAITKAGLLVGRRLLLTAADMESVQKNEKFRLVTAYVGMAGEHKGRLLEGQENILKKFNPNAGGKSYLYQPRKDGVILIENKGGLFYHWTIAAPEA